MELLNSLSSYMTETLRVQHQLHNFDFFTPVKHLLSIHTRHVINDLPSVCGQLISRFSLEISQLELLTLCNRRHYNTNLTHEVTVKGSVTPRHAKLVTTFCVIQTCFGSNICQYKVNILTIIMIMESRKLC